VALVFWRFRRQYASLGWSWSWWPVGVGAAVCAIWLLFVPATLPGKSLWMGALQTMPWRWAVVWMAFRVVGYVAVTPVVEELAFRAYLMRRLQGAHLDDVPLGQFSWIAVLGSSVVFGVLHGSMWMAGTIAGVAFALALCRRRAFGDAVIAHAVANGLLAVYACVSGHWSVWS
jgi:CAAX prenyl protease-like protein